jgi:hypothetical protein
MKPTLRQVAGPVLATVALHVALMALYLSRLDGDPSAFVCAGANRIGQPPYEAITKACGPSGHDGQFYYALARAPWKWHDHDMDLAPFRHVRILYPALCWALSSGHPVLLFYVMPAVNLAAVAALAGLGAAFALAHGRSAWWGFVLTLGANAGISVLHNFTDCVSTLAVVGLMLAWLGGGRWWAVTLWAAAAVFAREQNVAVAGLIVLAAVWKGRRDVAAGVTAVCTLWTAWAAVLWISYGAPPFASGAGAVTMPLGGLFYRLRHLGDTGLRVSLRLGILHFLSTLHLLAMVGAGLWALRWRPSRVVCLLLAGGAALAGLGGPAIYVDFSSYLRVFVWVPVGLWLAGLVSGRTWPLALLTPGVVWSLVVALRYA